jgi:hypothetical protein
VIHLRKISFLEFLYRLVFFRFSKPMIRLNKWWMARIESQVVGIIVLFHSPWVEDIILKKRGERLNYILVQTPLLIFRYFDILQMPFFVVDRTMVTLQSSDEERVSQKMHFYYRSWSNSGFSLRQFDDAFEGVCSLRNIGAVKLVCYFFTQNINLILWYTNSLSCILIKSKEKPLSSERIIANFTELKSKLTVSYVR